MENTAGFLQKRKLRNGLVKPNLSFLGLAEDKRFAQLAVPESAFAYARLLRPLHRFSCRCIVRRTRSVKTLTPRKSRLSARIFPTARENGTTAEDKRFEIRLRRFTLFHQASKSQVLSHFFTFAFHQLSQHFTKTKDT